MSERAAIFIDGGYLDHVLRGVGAFGRLDYTAFATALAGEHDLLRVYYYHCLPWQSPQPTTEESERLGRMQRFLGDLDRLPRYLVRQGRLVRRNRDGQVKFEQKQVDVLLSTDLVLLSAKHLIGEAIIVAGDSDFLPAVRVARDEGVGIRLIHGGGRQHPSNELWDTADERLTLTAEWLTHSFKPGLPPRRS